MHRVKRPDKRLHPTKLTRSPKKVLAMQEPFTKGHDYYVGFKSISGAFFLVITARLAAFLPACADELLELQ
jgi:hypothetical protein